MRESDRWLDLGPEQRRALPRALAYGSGLFLASLVPLGAFAWALRSVEANGFSAIPAVGMVVAAAGCVAGLGVTALILFWTPRFLARQGVEFGDDGLRLVQEPRWWFRGRAMHVRWEDVDSFTPSGAAGPRRWTWRVLGLRGVAPHARPPHWTALVLAGGEPPRGVARSATIRLFLQLREDSAAEFTRLLESHRSQAEPAPRAEPGRATAARGWLALRRSHRVAWLLLCLTALLLPAVPLGPLVLQDGLARLDPGDPAVALFAVMSAVGLSAALVAAPWQWAEQGMVVTDRGLGFERRPLWWVPERRGFVRWEDVLGTAVREVVRTSPGEQHQAVVEVYLDRLDASERFPGWVRRVRAGEALWGEATDCARLVVPLGDPQERSRVSLLLAQASPPSLAGPSALGAGPRSTYWIPVRRWVLPALMVPVLPICAVSGVALAAATAGSAPAPGIWAGVLGFAAVGLAAAARLLPPLCARQGIVVDDDGLRLVREPLLWSRELTARVRWEHVRAIRPGTALTLSRLGDWNGGFTFPVTDVVVERRHAPARTPWWARTGGADPDVVRLRLCPGAEQHPLLSRAVQGRVGRGSGEPYEGGDRGGALGGPRRH
ncbi:hypothetical protein [Murinocardiopsis flavida]|uniref:hypothetical protein n=1 Tax=Murinocardiopsis flavida TaxID=645275 RepID=UPI000D0D5C2A|nr:hypothetical protein [Murinocardiopsis flavida]